MLAVRCLLSAFVALACIVCRSAPVEARTRSGLPLTPELCAVHHPTGTRSELAQRFFDQGLTLAFAFNHDAATECFEAAAALDPEDPLPWWGIALVHGPHINNPAMVEAQVQRAWSALGEARARQNRATSIDRELIEALGARYAQSPEAKRRPLDEAYARAVGEVWRRHPDQPDVGVL